MIVLVTDFGLTGPYTGQIKAVLADAAPATPVIDLFADAPMFDPRAAAYLLATYTGEFAAGAIFLCIVDPGVGGDRLPVIVEADRRWFVGPDNGVFELVMRRAATPVRCWRITWRPDRLSATFHGRDLFAPVAAALARGEPPAGTPMPADGLRHRDWPDELPLIIYIDHYGNAITGLRAATAPASATLTVAGITLTRASSFCDVPVGQAFFYENSSGLLEIAVHRGDAAKALGIGLGAPVILTEL